MQFQRAIFDGIRVLDLSRLAPGPYCSMLLGDLGADVIVIGGGRGGLPIEAYRRGKRFIQLDLKCEAGVEALRRLVHDADVLIEGFRPGVCDRLGIGYEAMHSVNPRLIYCSLTGYGQDGPLAEEAGHDLNYVALSGALGAFGPAGEAPTVPLNLLADFAGGGLYAAYAITAALFERERSGEGQHLDVSMVDGCASLMAMHYADWGKPVLPSRGRGLLTGEAPFYRCYRCADGKYVAVGALERAFFLNLWTGLGLEQKAPDHMDSSTWPAMTRQFEEVFGQRSRDAWVDSFVGTNACVSPVLAPDEVFRHAHMRARHPQAVTEKGGIEVPAIPKFSRSPAQPGMGDFEDHSVKVLRSVGLSPEQIEAAVPHDAATAITGLVWPPVR